MRSLPFFQLPPQSDSAALGARPRRSSASSSLVSSGIALALSQGFQISPDGLDLLERYLIYVQKKKEHRKGGVLEEEAKEENVFGIVNLAIEQKIRVSFSNMQAPVGDSFPTTAVTTTITAKDLADAAPDLFSDILVEGHPKGEEDNGCPSAHSSRQIEADVVVLDDPSSKMQPVGLEGFSQLFRSRYGKLLRILSQRPESRNLTKVSQLKEAKKGSVRVAGLVMSKRQAKNGVVELMVDDDTGQCTILAVSEEAKKAAGQVALDQCAMIEAEVRGEQARGAGGGGTGWTLLARSIVQPDVPNHLASTSKKPVFAVFTSDLHIGSNKFLEGAFVRFIDWISSRGQIDETDQEIIRRLKYIVIGGDIVDGVGVFPNQEFELLESDVRKQYGMVFERLSRIPKHLRVLIIPGNHDSTRQALPQPTVPRKYAESLYGLPNIMMLGDPCLVRLHGVSVMVFHGRSLDDVLATTPGLSYERPAEAMKVLLRARHLAPIFGSRTPIAPDVEDRLVINEVPDIFHAGHVHSVGFETYKGTLVLNSGTWQAQTGYQSNLGIMPRPGLVPLVNLATLDVVWKEFLVSNSTNVNAPPTTAS